MQTYARGEFVIVVDCADLDRSATFWSEVLGYRNAGAAGSPYVSLLAEDGSGIELLLQKVSDRKRGKNRVHIDLRTRDLAAETERVVLAGAIRVTDDPIIEGGWVWHVLTDPDGNEFCVLQPPEDHWPESSRTL